MIFGNDDLFGLPHVAFSPFTVPGNLEMLTQWAARIHFFSEFYIIHFGILCKQLIYFHPQYEDRFVLVIWPLKDLPIRPASEETSDIRLSFIEYTGYPLFTVAAGSPTLIL
jgi:hypothetical protein